MKVYFLFIIIYPKTNMNFVKTTLPQQTNFQQILEKIQISLSKHLGNCQVPR